MQRAVQDGSGRFLFEMATGIGKTLTAAVIKLFLRLDNASRVLFLADRLELEDQAHKVFTALLLADFQTVVYKENRSDWNRAEIEGYQKVIDGARDVVNNYRPQIPIDPDWPMVELGEVCKKSQYGLSARLNTEEIGYKTFRMNELIDGRCVDSGKYEAC